MKTYQIINKIFVQKKNKLGFLKLLLNICVVALALLSLFQLLMGEPLSKLVRPLVVAFVLAGYAKTRCTSSGYDSVALELTFFPDGIQMVYPTINRNDGGGLRRETIQIGKAGLLQIMYSNELKSIRILAEAIIRVEYEKDHKVSTIDGRAQSRASEHIIYLPPDKKYEIIEEIEKCFQTRIERVS